jgi:hypothetical protein
MKRAVTACTVVEGDPRLLAALRRQQPNRFTVENRTRIVEPCFCGCSHTVSGALNWSGYLLLTTEPVPRDERGAVQVRRLVVRQEYASNFDFTVWPP